MDSQAVKQTEDGFRKTVFGPIFRMVLCAGSGMGKTTFLLHFLAQIDELCPVKFEKIVIHYQSFNPLFQEMYANDPTRIELKQDMSIDLSDVNEGKSSLDRTLWIFEDFISIYGSESEKNIEHLFSKVCVFVAKNVVFNNLFFRSVTTLGFHFWSHRNQYTIPATKYGDRFN